MTQALREPWLKGLRLATTLFAAALLLAGCYADLDWRKLASEEGRFQMLMPARTQSASREIAPGVTMTVWSTSAANALFGVSYTDYPDAARGHLAAARDALLRNVSGTLLEDDASPQPKGMTAGESRRLVIKGSVGGNSGGPGNAKGADAGKDVSVHARLFAVDRRLYQLTLIGKGDKLTESDRDMFFSSFELR
jgi:hypothetical protein